jgi:diguanylate cyclase (GGDEF)-like protein
MRPKEPTPTIQDIVDTLAAQLSLSEATCASHAELVSLAHHDQLTSISNRAAFFASVGKALEAAPDRAKVALMVIDLDDFKVVNDSLGHAAGDRVLIEIARRLTALAADHGVAGRFGGDEFAVLLWDVENPDEAERIARLACEQLIEPVPWESQQLQVGASIGVVTGMPGADVSELMRCADIAMYSAKAMGKNRVVRFSDADHGSIASMRQLEAELPGGEERRERLNALRAGQGQDVKPVTS